MNNQWVNTPLQSPFLMGNRYGTHYAPISDKNLAIITSKNLTTDGFPDNDK